MTLQHVLEALLFSAQKPLAICEIAAALKAAGAEDELTPNEFGSVRDAEIAAALQQLKIEYLEQQRAFQLIEKADGWQLATDPGYGRWVRQLFRPQAHAFERARTGDPRHYRLPATDYARRCGSRARRHH